jgi:hypothetical protein
MSVERRLREGLASNAEDFDPHVERRLARVVSRRRHRQRLRRGAVVVATAALLAVCAVLAPGLFGPNSRTVPVEVGKPTGSADFGQILTGTYSTTIPAAPGVVTSASLAGRWTLTFKPDGTLAIQTPPAYTGVLSAALFTSTPSGFRSGIFDQDLCSGLGIASYRWTRSGPTLKFRVADDRCAGRVAVFTSATWGRIS